MKSNNVIQENTLIHKALTVLIKNFGVLETNRFLSIINNKKIDSIKRHQNWQDQLNKDDLFKKIFNKK
jgi:hypothetical protein